MTRQLLAMTFFAVASTAVAAPVPKSFRPKPIQLSGPRPLMIRVAVVENSEVKLTRNIGDSEPRTADLCDVAASDRSGNPLSVSTLKMRLRNPVAVLITPIALPQRAPDRVLGEDPGPAEVDTGDEWRMLLSADTIVIDGAAFGLDWEYGKYDLQIVQAEADDGEVSVTTLSTPLLWRTQRCDVGKNLIECDPKGKDTAEYMAKVRTHRAVIFHQSKDLSKESKGLFRSGSPFSHDDGHRHLKTQRIHGSIL